MKAATGKDRIRLTAGVGRMLAGEEKPSPKGASTRVTACQARQKRLDRDHPFARLASFVASRIMNPGLGCKQRAVCPVIGEGQGQAGQGERPCASRSLCRARCTAAFRY